MEGRGMGGDRQDIVREREGREVRGRSKGRGVRVCKEEI